MAGKEELYDRAIDLIAEDKVDEAIAVYREALALDASYTDAWHGLAMAHAAKERFDEAIEAGEKLLELDPEDPLAYANLSRFCQRKGDVAGAEAWAAKARVLEWKRQLAAGEEK